MCVDRVCIEQEYETIRTTYEKVAEQLEAQPLVETETTGGDAAAKDEKAVSGLIVKDDVAEGAREVAGEQVA
jgi:hypothetical protein